MLQKIKQFFCSHTSIKISTQTSNDENLVFMVESLIKCTDCEKSFAQHPRAMCCYVDHIHIEILKAHYLKNMTDEINAKS